MILCAGEALIDMIPATAKTGEAAFVPRAGGAPFNSAIGLARLGVKTGFATGLSLDSMGGLLADVAVKAGVDLSCSQRSNRPTTLAMVSLKDGHASYSFHDAGSALRELRPGDLPLPRPLPDALLIGGICLASEPCGSAFEALCRDAHHAGVTIMFDPNIRPDFIADEAAFRARIDRMIAMADIVKLSDEDMDWLMGADTVETHAKTVLSQGPALVCITRGSQGITAIRTGNTVSVPAENVQVVDTVGAGDTFNAGFLAGLARQSVLARNNLAGLEENALRRALTLGARAAAICVSRAGANPPTLAEVEAQFGPFQALIQPPVTGSKSRESH